MCRVFQVFSWIVPRASDQECATGSASASFYDQKPIVAIFRWTALAEPVAHETLAKKTISCDVAIQNGVKHSIRSFAVSQWLREKSQRRSIVIELMSA